MTQLDLFDDPPASRLSDPPTSRMAEQAAKAEIKSARERMYQAFRNGPKTANEAADECVQWYGGSHETYRKRSGELAKAGLIRTTSSRRCLWSGHVAEVWELVR